MSVLKSVTLVTTEPTLVDRDISFDAVVSSTPTLTDLSIQPFGSEVVAPASYSHFEVSVAYSATAIASGVTTEGYAEPPVSSFDGGSVPDVDDILTGVGSATDATDLFPSLFGDVVGANVLLTFTYLSLFAHAWYEDGPYEVARLVALPAMGDDLFGAALASDSEDKFASSLSSDSEDVFTTGSTADSEDLL